VEGVGKCVQNVAKTYLKVLRITKDEAFVVCVRGYVQNVPTVLWKGRGDVSRMLQNLYGVSRGKCTECCKSFVE